MLLTGTSPGGICHFAELTETVPGLCRGQIRFYRKSAESCTVKLTISYEVPGPLAPFAGVSLKVIICLALHHSIIDGEQPLLL